MNSSLRPLGARLSSRALGLVVLLAVTSTGQAPADTQASRVPPGRTEYMGRTIAQTMHYTGAEWLIRNAREREERCTLMLKNLGVRPGMTVCDLGCGNGYHTLRLADLVGPQGQVLAVDIQPEMLYMLRARAEKEGVEQISPILSSVHNPRLPAASCDVVLMVDVYHELTHPEQVLAAVRRALKGDGLLVLVEYRAEDARVPIKPLHKMSEDQVLRELKANGFQLARQYDKLPWQHMLFFRTDPQWKLPATAAQSFQSSNTE